MCVAIMIPDNWEPAKLVLWSTTIARAKNENLLIIRTTCRANRAKRKKASPTAGTEDLPLAAAIREHAEDFAVRDLNVENRKEVTTAARRADSSTRYICLKQLDHVDLIPGTLKEIKALHVSTFIVPRHRGVRFCGDEFASERELLSQVPCETLQLRLGPTNSDDCRSILVASSGSKNASPALSFGAKLAASKATDVTALYVDQKATLGSDSDAHEVVERFVRTSLGEDTGIVTSDSVVDKDVPKGLSSYAAAKGHDLIVVGAASQSTADQPSRTSVTEKLLAEMDDHTVVVVRKAIPLTGRLWRLLERLKKCFVPQLDREGRVELVKRLHASAQWDFDFFFLISVATMLAALGLSLNSSPVVIGAMLIAPLMTPMLGVGLSVVQGNRFMANDCLITIRRGFLAAFLTGCAVGIIRFYFTSSVTEEMASRGAPGILDLLVAFVSGVVAAYAFGRPHLLSVVPGIAIATSLVPPVATVGLSLSAWKLDLALGATLLFVSNFVAIVLGSATCLWFVGMRGPREFYPFSSWARRLMFGMFVVAICLALFSSPKNDHSSARTSSIVKDERSNRSAESHKLAHDEASKQESPPDAITDEKDDATTDLLVEQELEEVEVVLKPRVADGHEPTVVDVTLIVPNKPRQVELEGIVAEQRRPGWVILDLPPRERWADEKRWLTWLQQEGLESPNFYDLLEKHIAKRFVAESTKPM